MPRRNRSIKPKRSEADPKTGRSHSHIKHRPSTGVYTPDDLNKMAKRAANILVANGLASPQILDRGWRLGD